MKHGYWIDKLIDKYKKIESRCSECGWYGISDFDSYVDIFDFNYCPNCGAIMDGDDGSESLWVDDNTLPNEDMRPDNEVI